MIAELLNSKLWALVIVTQWESCTEKKKDASIIVLSPHVSTLNWNRIESWGTKRFQPLINRKLVLPLLLLKLLVSGMFPNRCWNMDSGIFSHSYTRASIKSSTDDGQWDLRVGDLTKILYHDRIHFISQLRRYIFALNQVMICDATEIS